MYYEFRRKCGLTVASTTAPQPMDIFNLLQNGQNFNTQPNLLLPAPFPARGCLRLGEEFLERFP